MKGQCTLVKFLSIFDELCDMLAEFRKNICVLCFTKSRLSRDKCEICEVYEREIERRRRQNDKNQISN